MTRIWHIRIQAKRKETMNSKGHVHEERNQKAKGSQLEARAVGLKVICPICKAQLANQNQLVDHYGSKHPKEKPPSNSE
ncbi:hypothetical protein CDL12_20922 [Handroanthus impetiginosus]|uniref:C2H2-type domain-containing protein n=1 Tax=Handroanthus impetiginosus TaxID=429701 RepID=A0A2G9GMJ8_9LAMI|nr:hypothetical protein CDL12_20922 [Handroanthus impetiginosus]